MITGPKIGTRAAIIGDILGTKGTSNGMINGKTDVRVGTMFSMSGTRNGIKDGRNGSTKSEKISALDCSKLVIGPPIDPNNVVIIDPSQFIMSGLAVPPPLTKRRD